MLYYPWLNGTCTFHHAPLPQHSHAPWPTDLSSRESRSSLPIEITDALFSTRVPSNMPSSLSSDRARVLSMRILECRIYIIVSILGHVSTTTSTAGTVSSAILDCALAYIEPNDERPVRGSLLPRFREINPREVEYQQPLSDAVISVRHEHSRRRRCCCCWKQRVDH